MSENFILFALQIDNLAGKTIRKLPRQITQYEIETQKFILT